jgi:hypothetical protein
MRGAHVTFGASGHFLTVNPLTDIATESVEGMEQSIARLRGDILATNPSPNATDGLRSVLDAIPQKRESFT